MAKNIAHLLLVADGKLKYLYIEKILRGLPDWFGNEKALQDYVVSCPSGLLWIRKELLSFTFRWVLSP